VWAESDRGRYGDNPLDAVVASETWEQARALLTDGERDVMELLREGMNQKDAAIRLDKTKGWVSQNVKSATGKIAKRFGLSPKECHFGKVAPKVSDHFKEHMLKQLELLRADRRPAFAPVRGPVGGGKWPTHHLAGKGDKK